MQLVIVLLAQMTCMFQIVLVASSQYFADCHANGDLLDVYNFDGVSAGPLQMVLNYMYRQIQWADVLKSPEAQVISDTLKVSMALLVMNRCFYDSTMTTCFPVGHSVFLLPSNITCTYSCTNIEITNKMITR